jgi:hypothetical protein
LSNSQNEPVATQDFSGFAQGMSKKDQP